MLNSHVPHHKNHANHARGRIANYSTTDLGVSKHDAFAQLNGNHPEATSTPAALKVSIEYASRIEIWWYPTYHRIKALGIFGSTI